MKVLKEGELCKLQSKEDNERKIICKNCGCEFQYDFEDYEQESINEWHMVSFVECPWCHERVILEEYKTPEQDRDYSLFPIYPDKFLPMSKDAIKLSDNDLNNWAKTVYNRLKENPDEESYIVATGDSLIVGFNDENGISLYVCKNYAEAVWDKNVGWLIEE